MPRLGLTPLVSLVLAASVSSIALAQSPRAARERLRAFEGTFRVSTGTAGDTASAVWRMHWVLGDKYLELEEVLKVRFRTTLGFDSTSGRYRMSLLDAGTGAFDIYEGDFDDSGALVLQNPQYWRVRFAPLPQGMRWGFERSTDRGVTWKVQPASVMTRISTP